MKQILNGKYIQINKAPRICMGCMLAADANGGLYNQNSHFVIKIQRCIYDILWIYLFPSFKMANAFCAVRVCIYSNLFVVVYMAYIFQVAKYVKLIRHLLRLATYIKELNKVMILLFCRCRGVMFPI